MRLTGAMRRTACVMALGLLAAAAQPADAGRDPWSDADAALAAAMIATPALSAGETAALRAVRSQSWTIAAWLLQTALFGAPAAPPSLPPPSS